MVIIHFESTKTAEMANVNALTQEYRIQQWFNSSSVDVNVVEIV